MPGGGKLSLATFWETSICEQLFQTPSLHQFSWQILYFIKYSEIESLLFICDYLWSRNQKRCSHLSWCFFTNILWYFLKLKIFFYGEMLESSDLIQSTIKVSRLDENKLIFKLDQILFLPDEWILRVSKACWTRLTNGK